MTMPHLTNCSHSNDGWCLPCVKQLADEHAELHAHWGKIHVILLYWFGTTDPALLADVLKDSDEWNERVKKSNGRMLEVLKCVSAWYKAGDEQNAIQERVDAAIADAAKGA